MTRYCAFFGTLNIGSDRLSLADLRYAFEREEFENVETVVASGNVLFDFEERPTEGLEDLLAHVMFDRFDIAAYTAVRSKDEVRAAFEGNPFTGIGQDHNVHTMFLSRAGDQAAFAKLQADHAERGPETLAMDQRSVYIDYVNGVNGSRLSENLIERRLDCQGISRNVRTLARIYAKM